MSERGSPSDHTGNDNANPDSGSPASEHVDGAAPASSSGDANSQADASSASGDQGAKKDAPKATLADVVKTAAETADASGKSPDPANDGKEKVEGDAKPDIKAEGETDDSKLPFHNHPRWKEVVSQKQTLEAKVKDLEPAAEQFGKIESFMQEHHLSHDEVGELFIVGAMAKAGDPRALQKIDEYRDRLALAIGEKLPDDIKEQVESGAITEAAGKELAKSRVTTKRLEADAKTRTENDENRRRNDAAENLSKECKTATTVWEEGARKTDPDFAKKEKAVARYARALMQERGFPKNGNEAVAIIKEAYAEVNKDFGSVIPQKQPVSRLPTAPSSNGAKAQPKSLAEAVRQAANS